MKNQKRRNNKKWLYPVIVLVLLLVVGGVTYLVLHNTTSNDQENTTVEEEEEKKAEPEAQPVETIEGNEGQTEEEVVEKEKVLKYEGEDPNKAEGLSGALTYAGVVDDKLMLRVNIDQYVNSGNCELTLRKGGATIYNSIASIIGSASTATCEGFDVPVAGLGGGLIEININLSADGRSGAIRGEVNI